MDPDPSKATEDSPEWGQRRRGEGPAPRPSWNEVREEFEQATRAWEAREADGGKRAQPGAAGRPTPGAGPDLSSLLGLLDALRRAAPMELQERTTALIREVLLTLRSLIDWYLDHLDRPAVKPEVEDIPID